jgi:hypothetical protein
VGLDAQGFEDFFGGFGLGFDSGEVSFEVFVVWAGFDGGHFVFEVVEACASILDGFEDGVHGFGVVGGFFAFWRLGRWGFLLLVECCKTGVREASEDGGDTSLGELEEGKCAFVMFSVWKRSCCKFYEFFQFFFACERGWGCGAGGTGDEERVEVSFIVGFSEWGAFCNDFP